MLQKKISFVLSLAILGAQLSAQEQSKDSGSFDRLYVMLKFLEAVYPDLNHTEGLVILRSSFHASGGPIDEIDVIPCRVGSGVPGGYVPGEQPPPRSCNGLYPSRPSDFLYFEVRWFSAEHPIRYFAARGSFVDSQAKTLLREIADHPEWSQEQRIDAVRRAKAKFGPDNKREFLQTVPIDAIQNFTGCSLRLESAVAYAVRYESPPDPPVATAGWRISGRYPYAPKDLQKCSAWFEPFEGKLVGVSD